MAFDIYEDPEFGKKLDDLVDPVTSYYHFYRESDGTYVLKFRMLPSILKQGAIRAEGTVDECRDKNTSLYGNQYIYIEGGTGNETLHREKG